MIPRSEPQNNQSFSLSENTDGCQSLVIRPELRAEPSASQEIFRDTEQNGVNRTDPLIYDSDYNNNSSIASPEAETSNSILSSGVRASEERCPCNGNRADDGIAPGSALNGPIDEAKRATCSAHLEELNALLTVNSKRIADRTTRDPKRVIGSRLVSANKNARGNPKQKQKYLNEQPLHQSKDNLNAISPNLSPIGHQETPETTLQPPRAIRNPSAIQNTPQSTHWLSTLVVAVVTVLVVLLCYSFLVRSASAALYRICGELCIRHSWKVPPPV